jgi:hypothetical protein
MTPLKPYRLLTWALLVSAPGCSLAPVPPGAPPAAPADEPAAARVSFRERLEAGAGRVRTVLAEGYGRVAEGVEEAIDSEAVRYALRPFIYAGLIIGYCAPR